ncbi:MAG: AAA family ATPase, partial [Candidatus Sabulitectum sp.]|nr:AAA family ATPase [Candidatus Sabulitectum sp.]
MKHIKKIPYGIASYDRMKEDNRFYFVDKTQYIEKIENLGSQFLFFLRPRRFGKSLFLSILEHYYDVNKKGRFEELFGDTYIGKNPTPLRNTYPILKLNFSGLSTQGNYEEIEKSFNFHVFIAISDFYTEYSGMFGNLDIQRDYADITDANEMITKFVSLIKANQAKFYLLIDEYDNFANNILIHHGKERYQRVTHQAGFLRSFFAAVKNGTESGAI